MSQPRSTVLNLLDPACWAADTDLALSIKRRGAIASIELNHAGCFANPAFGDGSPPIGPSAMNRPDGIQVQEMDDCAIRATIEDFARNAEQAQRLGFDMCMIHAGHGWLLSQFLSPLYNHRTDQYGGSFENRARFPLAVFKAVRQRCGDHFLIEARISAEDFCTGGITVEESIKFARLLEPYIDLLHISASDHNHPEVWEHGPTSHPLIPLGSNVKYAAQFKAAGIKTPIHQLFEYVNNDHDVEIMIFGGSGKNFFETIGPIDEYRDASKPFVPMDDTDPRYNWQLLEHSYIDGTQDIETQVNLSIPLIGVWNGGGFHSDLYFFTDITIATKDAWTTDTHFRLNMVPGDGIQIAWRSLMGIKRFNYAELTGDIITAKKALDYGMINEIEEDVESAYARAHEIADLIMHSSTRQTRRLTVQVMRFPWRKQIADELRGSFSTEMWNTLSEASPHYPLYWECAKAQARAALEAEAQGKVLRPRMGEFKFEDPIK